MSEHVSPSIRIRYDNAIRPNTNSLFRQLFGTEANTNRIFGISLVNGSATVVCRTCCVGLARLEATLQNGPFRNPTVCFNSCEKVL